MVRSLPTVRPSVTSSQLPNRVQGAPFGTDSASDPSKSLAAGAPSILQPGPAQAHEQFSAGPDIHPAVARALNQLQRNIAEAIGQSKGDPTAAKQLFENVTVKDGDVDGNNANVISHGLGKPYRGYRICSVRGGSLTGHAAMSPKATQPPTSAALLLWTAVKPFASGGAVSIDVEVYG